MRFWSLGKKIFDFVVECFTILSAFCKVASDIVEEFIGDINNKIADTVKKELPRQLQIEVSQFENF